ncbi:MAG: hypothetical protein DMH00_12435 [Acidobacteria bacterium]|nr:MAG: hypothetical protein DMH00_12435 [Acidobacteriota bacterium]
MFAAVARSCKILRVRRRTLSVFLLALSPFSQARADFKTDFRFLPTFFRGDFGSDVTTDITYLPFTLVLTTDRQEFRATLPFVSIHTEQPVTFVGGDVIGRKGAAGPSTESGLGDVILQEEYFFLRGSTLRPWISGLLMVKLPTADEAKGLGTGEVDYGPGASITQPLGSRLSLFGEARYVLRGSPPGEDFRNTRWMSAGGQLKVTPATSINTVYEDRQSVLAGRPDIRDVGLGLARRFPSGIVFRGSYYYGLSSTAEDWGISAGVSFSP